MGPSPWQLLIVLAIVIMLFGTKRLRGMGSDLGEAIKGFKKSVTGDEPTDADKNAAEPKAIDPNKAEPNDANQTASADQNKTETH
ncbi:twin-arginine translocase TatA/TatE family subunit [Gilvimarinus polysaccharolyticus]|uniref:twin-arginine translocase TatA/TatE family subunit n=1 Tax=Gilvimarinus polysaccharolyticus TaxID=863921 RepID=UPI000B16E57C|nr:twin-arginine translocase TatA/TatE family subunit [Gilvimarinus polysaccharolyticus]